MKTYAGINMNFIKLKDVQNQDFFLNLETLVSFETDTLGYGSVSTIGGPEATTIDKQSAELLQDLLESYVSKIPIGLKDVDNHNVKDDTNESVPKAERLYVVTAHSRSLNDKEFTKIVTFEELIKNPHNISYQDISRVLLKELRLQRGLSAVPDDCFMDASDV